MSRAERRRRERHSNSGLPWDKIIVAAVLVFFAISAGVAYFFPLITARSYAEGSNRIRRIIISRALDRLERTDPIEFAYYFTNEAGSTMRFEAKEADHIVTLTDPVTNVATIYDQEPLPAEFQKLCVTKDALAEALRNSDFVISFRENEQQFGHKILQVAKRDDAGKLVEGYELYFDANHALDEIHIVRRVGDDSFIQRVYSGLVAGGTGR